jgi:peptidoglycan/LPS O-acetylase OafA/YrhL
MNRQFGALTGLAMTLIVMNHSISIALDQLAKVGGSSLSTWELVILTVLQALGAFAVPIFFFISGSFVAYAAQGEPPRLSRKFLWSSLRHILVPYMIWSVIFYILVYIQHNERYSLLGYAKNLLVGYPFHFIPLLAVYYLLSPWLVILARRTAALLLILIGIYQLFSINVVFPGYLGFQFPEWARLVTLPVLRTTIADWGIYFPLGLVYGVHARRLLPWLKRYAWIFLLVTAILFVIGMLNAFGNMFFPIARLLCPLTFTLVVPAISRDQIPWVRTLEKIGKRSYGLYLTHLIILNLCLLLIQGLVRGVLRSPFLLFPILLALGIVIPMVLMELAARGPTRRVYRYLFG